MVINGTLLAQVVNFCIAYCLLRFFFLKPVNALIQQEDDVKKKQHEAIDIKKNQLDQQLLLKRDEWHACQQYFKEQSPSIGARYVRTKREAVVEVDEVSENEVQNMREEVKQFIITKVEHGA